jgi:hypothetical protein
MKKLKKPVIYLITGNWIISWLGFAVDTEKSTFEAVMIVLLYIALSWLLFIKIQRKGYLKEIEKRFKINES